MTKSKRAIMLATTLFLVTVFVMFTSALLQLAHGDLGSTRHVVDKVKAREACRAGLNHLIHRLTYAPTSQVNLSQNWGDGGYLIDFAATAPLRSVNNLSSLTLASVSNFEGLPVGIQLADVVVQGRWAGAHCNLHAVLTTGLQLSKSAGCDGPLVIANTSDVRGIRSLLDPTPTGGGLFSRFVSTNPLQPSITLPQYGFSLSETSSVVAPPAAGGESLDGPDLGNKFKEQSNDSVPDVNVSRLVSDQSNLPAPAGLTTVPGGFELAQPNLAAPNYVNGNLVVRGDLHLSSGSLYVKGDVTIYGGVAGEGSVFSDGNVKILGGTSSLRTNQRSGAALFAEGDVTLEGLDASGYLDSLSASHPALLASRNHLQTVAATAQAKMANEAASPVDRAWFGVLTLGGTSTGASDATAAQGLQGPNGTRGLSGIFPSPLLETAAQVKLALGSNYATDAKAQKIVHGLEQYSYDTRSNLFTTSDAIAEDYHRATPGLFSLTEAWDDNGLLPSPDSCNLALSAIASDNQWTLAKANSQGALFRSLSLDHQFRVVFGVPSATLSDVPDYLRGLYDQYNRQLKVTAALHPIDLNWLGTSNFQGIVYAKGNLTVDNKFTLYGTALSKKKITVQGESDLIYVEEYTRTLGHTGPVRVITAHEL